MAETAPVVGLCWRMQGYAMQHYVKDFHNMPNYLTFLSGWTLEQTSLDKIG